MSAQAATANEQQAASTTGEPAKSVFTAEEVERMKANWSENISRHEEKATKAVKELESIKARAAKEAEERRLAEMSEVERAKAALAEKEREIATIREQRMADKINAEVRLAGLREGAVDADDLVLFVGKNGIEVGEDGTVKGIDEAIASLKERKPHLFKSTNEPKKPAGQHPPSTAAPVKSGGSTMRRGDFFALTPGKQGEFLRGGGVVID